MSRPPESPSTPRPSPLVTVTELAARLHEPDLRIVDCRWYLGRPGAGHEAYASGQLPGALHLDVDTDLTAPTGPGRHPLPDPGEFAARLAAAGIGDSSFVVAYDDLGGWVAARLWWILESLGHPRVAVLDGGLQAWTAAGLPLSTDPPSYPPADLHLAARWTRTIDRDALRARLGSLTLLDARAGPRYRGEVEPIDAVAGHIPTAVSAPTDSNLAQDGRFLAPAVLATRYAELEAADPERDVVVSCGSGVSATHLALAMRIAGLPEPLLYPGSYSDWTQHGFPIVTGPDPGDPPGPPD
jgi:thiosulfate/3-mercaptopyruvate sulfurtransferase